jgi:predicted PhzF superfamily epimerase YddE/YHI9
MVWRVFQPIKAGLICCTAYTMPGHEQHAKTRKNMTPALDRDSPDRQEGGDTQLITAFVPGAGHRSHAENSSGNPCLLSVLADAPVEPAPSDAGLTCCYSWPTHYKNEAVIAVSCYTPHGNAIQCCGHGLLAAAHSWQQRLQCSEISLLMNHSLVPSWRHQKMTWLRFKRLATTACPVPDWVVEVFPNQPQPIAASVCGEEQGYMILQWPDDFHLKSLSQPLGCLSERSQRALICTAAQTSVGADAIALRYFAPQYGVPEDTATGSAMRVLAEYWSPRFTGLTAEQCSPAGGLLFAKWTPGHIDVGGRCSIFTAGNI